MGGGIQPTGRPGVHPSRLIWWPVPAAGRLRRSAPTRFSTTGPGPPTVPGWLTSTASWRRRTRTTTSSARPGWRPQARPFADEVGADPGRLGAVAGRRPGHRGRVAGRDRGDPALQPGSRPLLHRLRRVPHSHDVRASAADRHDGLDPGESVAVAGGQRPDRALRGRRGQPHPAAPRCPSRCGGMATACRSACTSWAGSATRPRSSGWHRSSKRPSRGPAAAGRARGRAAGHPVSWRADPAGGE